MYADRETKYITKVFTRTNLKQAYKIRNNDEN
jgi:hypothetical protein